MYNHALLERNLSRRERSEAITAMEAARGYVTASLQATPMAERLYAGLGFRDLGRFFEYVPSR